MKKLFFFLSIFCCFNLCSNAQHGEADTAKTVTPFRIFDNLYYVGNDFVSSYLLTTTDGLILIDAMYGKYPKNVLQSIHDLGFDPKKIKYILCTHGHWDHYDGADTLKKVTHAHVGMTEPDWQMVKGTRDLVFHDGDSLTLGNTMLKFYVTPGHTPGVLSIAFPVREGNKTYKAFMFGGVGLNFTGVKRTETYIRSVDRLLKMKDVQVNITNHPFTGKIFERAALLKQRKQGEINPFVAPADFQSWLKELRMQAEKKLAEEKAKA